QPRFQDVATRMGFIDRAVRDMAVDVQERLSKPVSMPSCGWAPSGAEGSGNQFSWLVSAISETDRDLWVAAFRKNRIRVDALLPGWGLSPSVPTDGGSLLTLERHNRAVFARRETETGIETLRLLDLSAQTASEDDVIGRIFDGPMPDAVVARGFDEQAAGHITAYAPNATITDDWPSVALDGLARRQLGDKAGASATPAIAPRDPAKPLLKNPNFYRVALIGAVLIGVGAIEGYNRQQIGALEAQLDELKREFEQKRSITQNITAMNQKIKTLKSTVATTEEEIDTLTEQTAMFGYLQDRRRALPVGILNAVQGAAHGELIMQSISESKHLGETFVARAWSISEIGAERFITKLNENLSSIGLSVADESVERAPGPRGIRGFTIRILIAKGPAQKVEVTE
ncbi:MAG: hypothetical protein AAF334_11275, partial [Pseudomonadota bacterium]